MYSFDRGKIAVNGNLLPKGFNSNAAIAKGVAYATESRRLSLFLEDAIYKNITLPHLSKISGIMPSLAKELDTSRKVIKRTNVQPPEPLRGGRSIERR